MLYARNVSSDWQGVAGCRGEMVRGNSSTGMGDAGHRRKAMRNSNGAGLGLTLALEAM
jgi:hypothetical protein